MSDGPPPGWGQPGPPPGQGYPPQPPGGFGPPPGQPPYGQPSGGFGSPGQLPYGQAPTGPPGYGAGPYGGQPPGSGGYGAPPPKKSNGGLIAALVVLLLVVIGGVGTFLALRSGAEDPETTPVATAATPGTAIPGTGIPGTATAAPGTPTPFPTASDPGQPGGGGEASVFELAVGTCFNDPDSASEIQSVGSVPCEMIHDNEVFGLVDFPAGPEDAYPGREAVTLFGDEQCQGGIFADYVGIEYANSRYFASQLTPTEGSWAQGDREIVCVLYDTTTQITGSVRGTAE